MILCPNCGANPRFDIASQKMLCPFCGTYSEPTDERYAGNDGADTQTVTGDYAGQPDMMQVTIYTCAQCGAELMSTGTDATAFCSYCGTHQVLQERLDVKKRPDHIIPFKITKDQCKEIYRRKLSKMMFAPRALKDPQYIDEFRGIYMPYWFYSFRQQGRLSVDGTQEHRSGNYRIIDHYNLSVDADNYYTGISHDASSSFEDKMSESLAPYNTHDTLPFRTAYLSGFYADIPDTDEKTYEAEAAVTAADDAYRQLISFRNFRGYNTSGNSDGDKVGRTHTRLVSAANAMFPVWFLSYRKGDRVAYAAINGQTGKMTADVPIDGKRYLLWTAVLTLIIWALLEIFNISSLRGILMTVILGAFGGNMLYTMVLDRLLSMNMNRSWEKKESELAAMRAGVIPNQALNNDAPDNNKKKKEKKKTDTPKKKRPEAGFGVILLAYVIIVAICAVAIWIGLGVATLLVPIIMAAINQFMISGLEHKRGTVSNWALAVSMVISLAVWVVNPYKDPVYYGCCLFMTVCVVWCFFDVLYYYNQLMTRPLPQFNKHGGDDRA